MPIRRLERNGVATGSITSGPSGLTAIDRIVKSYGQNPADREQVEAVLSKLAKREAARQRLAIYRKPRKRKHKSMRRGRRW